MNDAETIVKDLLNEYLSMVANDMEERAACVLRGRIAALHEALKLIEEN